MGKMDSAVLCRDVKMVQGNMLHKLPLIMDQDLATARAQIVCNAPSVYEWGICFVRVGIGNDVLLVPKKTHTGRSDKTNQM